MGATQKASSHWKPHFKDIQVSISFNVIILYKASLSPVYLVHAFIHESLLVPMSSSSSTWIPLIIMNSFLRIDFHPYNLYSLTVFELRSILRIYIYFYKKDFKKYLQIHSICF